MRDAVGAGAAAVLRVYEERAAELGLAAALRRGPRCPSLADALEGLRDVERYYRHLYPSLAGLSGQRWRAPFSLCRPYRARRYLESKLLLLRVSCGSLADMEALPQAWERILERCEEDVVQGSSTGGRPGAPLLSSVPVSPPRGQRAGPALLSVLVPVAAGGLAQLALVLCSETSRTTAVETRWHSWERHPSSRPFRFVC